MAERTARVRDGGVVRAGLLNGVPPAVAAAPQNGSRSKRTGSVATGREEEPTEAGGHVLGCTPFRSPSGARKLAAQRNPEGPDPQHQQQAPACQVNSVCGRSARSVKLCSCRRVAG